MNSLFNESVDDLNSRRGYQDSRKCGLNQQTIIKSLPEIFTYDYYRRE